MRTGPTDTIDIPGLISLAQKIVGGIGGFFGSQVAQDPAKAQGNVIGDPSQIKINYGAVPTATPAPNLSSISPTQIQQGFQKFDPNAPLATQSGVISQALTKLSPNIDPRLILALALKETRGGSDLVDRQDGLNNNFNVMAGGKLVNYPDLQTALTGGDNPLENHSSQGLINILNNDLAYSKFRQSGKLEDFFSKYSPPSSGNADMPTQIQQAQKLMGYFK